MSNGIKNFAFLAVFLVLGVVFFSAFYQGASGTAAQAFNMGRQLMKIAAVLFPALGLWFIGKELTR